MSIKLKDTIYDLINNSDKLDGKDSSAFSLTSHTHSDYALSDHTHNYANSSHTHNYTSTIKIGSNNYNVSGNIITLPNYPTSLKNPTSLSWSGYSSGSYDGSTAKTITIPNNTNQLTNGAGFITTTELNNFIPKRLISPYYYNSSVIGSDTTADDLFGETASSSYSFSAFMSSHPIWNGWADVWNFSGYCKYGATQFATQHNSNIPRAALRKYVQSTSSWGSWREFAFLDSKVASATNADNASKATKLTNSRTIWGQSFNGTANIASTSDIYVNKIRDANSVYILSSENDGIYLGSSATVKPIILQGSLSTPDFFTGKDGNGSNDVYIQGNGNKSFRIQYYKTSTTWDQLKLQDGALYFNNYIVYHSGNFSSSGAYLPLTGGTLTNSDNVLLRLNTTGGIQSCLLLDSGETAKGQLGWVKDNGVYIYSHESAKHLGIDNNGNPYWGNSSSTSGSDHRLLWHTGNLNTIWGQSPNSSGVVTGSMTGVTDINWTNGGYIWNNTKGTHINPSSGSEGVFDVDMNNNVGIGTNAPTEKLDVRGNMNVSGRTYYNNNSYVGKGSSSSNDLCLFTNTVLRMYASYNTYPSYIYFSGISGSQLLHFAGQPQTEFRNQNNQAQIHLCNSYAIFGYHNSIAGLPTYIDGKDVYIRYGTNHAYTATFENTGAFNVSVLKIGGELITFTT